MKKLELRLSVMGKHERVAIVNIAGKREYWTGKGWSENKKDAVLFLKDVDTALAVRDIYLYHCDKKDVRAFKVTIEFNLLNGADVLIDDYDKWLRETTMLVMAPNKGNGPTEDSVSLAKIVWNTLEEKDAS